jgi:hypothetical protein
MTAGGNLINYKSSAFGQTVDLDTENIDWNSVISTVLTKYMCLDIQNFYLTAVLKIPLTSFTAWILEQYDLTKHALNGYVHLEMRRVVWGLPQVGILANKHLSSKLASFGCYESTNTPGLWCHKTRPIMFTQVVDDFGINYINKDDVNHLISSIKKYDSFTKDWMGNLYCGIQLNWGYEN